MLLLYAKGHKGQRCEPIRGRTRLMKMIFLFAKEMRPKFDLDKIILDNAIPSFTPYDYGPFSDRVFTDLEFLVELGFVRVTPIKDSEVLPEEASEYNYWQAGADPTADPEQREHEEEFSLASLGQEFVKDGRAGKLSPNQWAALDEFKARCTSAPLHALLRYVYAKYEDMTKRSKIRNHITVGRRP